LCMHICLAKFKRLIVREILRKCGLLLKKFYNKETTRGNINWKLIHELSTKVKNVIAVK